MERGGEAVTGDYLLGVDIGTYSSKGVLVTRGGSVVAQATVAHALAMPKPGRFEHDADGVWWSDFVTVTRRLLAASGIEAGRIAGVGTSGIGPCVLPVDSEGRPLRPGILYGIDTRASEEIAYLERKLGTRWIRRHGKGSLSAQSSGPKILWLRTHEPEVFDRARWFLTSQAYLVQRLTGAATIDVYTASSYAPLFDAEGILWNRRAAGCITGLEKLPKVCWSTEIAGEVTAAAARQTGLAEGTPVIVGTTDAAAEAVSAGVSASGEMMLMFGSTIFFIARTRELRASRVFWCSSFLEKDTYALAGGMSTGGSLTTWFRDEFGRPEIDIEGRGGENAFTALAKLAEKSPPGANGLIALPYFAGERTPLNDPDAKGVIFGLSLRHARSDVYRAILEGIGYGVAHNLAVMGKEGIQPSRILSVGGGTKNVALLQIVADIAGVELTVPEVQMGAAYGDAFMAAVGIGAYRSASEIGQWVRYREPVVPRRAYHDRYRAGFKRYRELYEATKPIMRELSVSQAM